MQVVLKGTSGVSRLREKEVVSVQKTSTSEGAGGERGRRRPSRTRRTRAQEMRGSEEEEPKRNIRGRMTGSG